MLEDKEYWERKLVPFALIILAYIYSLYFFKKNFFSEIFVRDYQELLNLYNFLIAHSKECKWKWISTKKNFFWKSLV